MFGAANATATAPPGEGPDVASSSAAVLQPPGLSPASNLCRLEGLPCRDDDMPGGSWGEVVVLGWQTVQSGEERFKSSGRRVSSHERTRSSPALPLGRKSGVKVGMVLSSRTDWLG